MLSNPDLRIAWLLPVAWFYWQPAISNFTKIFPKTKIFTALWPGFAKGFEDTLQIEVIGSWKVLQLAEGREGYGSSFTYVSLGIIGPLIKFRPHIIFTNSFGVWTVLALLLKPLIGWQVVIAYEGSSPGVDFRNSILRLTVRRVMVAFADALISNSHSGRAYLIEILAAKPEKVFAHPYEVPAAESLSETGESSILTEVSIRRPVFLFVGRIMARKGLKVLLEACKILRVQGTDNFTLLVVGDGEQQPELVKLTQDYELDSHVSWLGRVEYSEISACFAQSDVFVLPTFEDTWGVVVLEAMLLGKPVLCSSGAGSSEMIVNGQNGYVFNPNSPDILAQRMQNLIENEDCLPAMGNASRKIMAKHNPVAAAQFLAEVVYFLESKPSPFKDKYPASTSTDDKLPT
ncbi:MAG: glycosyltransferase family 4 protein [Cyanobacteria bacterium P01_D01_bin.56]